MRSASLPGAAWRRACRCRESLSPGKVKEPGRLAGEAGTELQKEPPFCRGLLGGKGSLPNGEGDAAAAARGECRGEGAPGLALPTRFPDFTTGAGAESCTVSPGRETPGCLASPGLAGRQASLPSPRASGRGEPGIVPPGC